MKKVKLGEILTFQRGYDLPSQYRNEGEYPIISSSGISGTHNDYRCDGSNVITGRYGTIGDVYYYNGKCWPLNTALFISDFKGNYPLYIYYFLKTVLKVDGKDKSTVPGVNRNVLHQMNVSYHENVDIQKSISYILLSLDNKIELNNKINKELEAMAKELYDYWFVQFDFPDRNGKPYKSSGGKMEWNEQLKRNIPKNWCIENITEATSLQYGFPFDTDFFNDKQHGVPIIRIRDILENSIGIYSTEKYIDKKYELFSGDLLIGMDGNFHINHWFLNNCYLNQRVVRLRKKDLSTFVIKFQIEPAIKQKESVGSGSTVSHLNDNDVKSMCILIPSNDYLSEVNLQFDNILHKILKTQFENQTLSQLRDFLLPLLMSGQVTIKDVEGKVENIISFTDKSSKDQRFKLWLSKQKTAARGELDRQTLREIFDAMDEDDK